MLNMNGIFQKFSSNVLRATGGPAVYRKYCGKVLCLGSPHVAKGIQHRCLKESLCPPWTSKHGVPLPPLWKHPCARGDHSQWGKKDPNWNKPYMISWVLILLVGYIFLYFTPFFAINSWSILQSICKKNSRTLPSLPKSTWPWRSAQPYVRGAFHAWKEWKPTGDQRFQHRALTIWCIWPLRGQVLKTSMPRGLFWDGGSQGPDALNTLPGHQGEKISQLKRRWRKNWLYWNDESYGKGLFALVSCFWTVLLHFALNLPKKKCY